MTSVYELKNVSFHYDNNQILENLNFSIPRGKIISIVGPNGSGKTTLLKILLGLLKPTEGEVYYHQVLLNKTSRENFKVGYLPQFASHEGLNLKLLIPVFDVVGMAFINKINKKEKEKKILDILDFFKILSLQNKLFYELSGGQKQRVLLARALINSPEVLILDEPLTGIDPDNKNFIYDTLRDLSQKHGMTIILVTHDLNIVPMISDLVGCINKKIYFHQDPDNFLQCPVFEEEMQSGLELLVHGTKFPHRCVFHHNETKKGF